MKKVVEYNSISGNLYEKIPTALYNLDWKFKVLNSTFTINFPINWISSGSIMKIDLIDDQKCIIEIRPKFFTQIIDLGDGKFKINKLLRELHRLEKKLI